MSPQRCPVRGGVSAFFCEWKVMKTGRIWLGMMAMVLAGAALAQQGTVGVDYRVGPRDVLDIKVAQDAALNTREPVGEDGRITMPNLGKVEVSGLTPLQIEGLIKSRLEESVLQRADVSVRIVEYGNKPISVVGAVTRPGPINATGNISLIQALTSAGGLAQGYGKTLYVLRSGQNGLTEQLAIDIEDLLVKGNPILNIPLAPSDVINVPADMPITVYVIGEVMRPGAVTFRRSQNPTLLQALAGAGGLTDRASKTIIIKRVVNGEPKTLTFNYRRITRGSSPDVTLLDNDTVVVNESFL